MFFFLSEERKKETFFDLLDRNKCFFDVKCEVLKKSKKSTFCKGVSPWFLSKNRPVFHMFFLSKKSQKETFFDILDRKECWVSPWFLSKNRPFSYKILFEQKTKKETFFDILDRK